MKRKHRKNRAYDYIVNSNVLYPLYLMPREEFLRVVDAYNNGEVELFTVPLA